MLRTLTRTAAAVLLLTTAACSDEDPTSGQPDTVEADTTGDVTPDGSDTSDTISAEDTGAGTCEPAPDSCPAAGEDVPPRLSEHAAAYDDATAQMLVFGGTTGVPENCNPAVAAAYVDTTWLFDDVCNQWRRVTGPGPSARGRHAMAAGDGSAWIFGGRWREDGATSGRYTMFDELWRFDFSTEEWERIEPVGGRPAPRANPVLAWDSNASRLLLFGGNMSASGLEVTPLDDVWSFDPATNAWEELETGFGPSPRLGASGAFDAVRDRFIVFGGFDSFDFGGGVAYFRDLWALDMFTMTWRQMPGDPSPPEGRFGAGLVHDTVDDLYVLFGGHDDQALGNRNDVWFYSPTVEGWTRLTPGDQPNAPQNGPCDFPPDFTTVDTSLPERRAYPTFVWSETCGHGLLFGGKTDCGAANDVWEYGLEVFGEAFEATAGEVCYRFRDNPDNCVNLCF